MSTEQILSSHVSYSISMVDRSCVGDRGLNSDPCSHVADTLLSILPASGTCGLTEKSRCEKSGGVNWSVRA